MNFNLEMKPLIAVDSDIPFLRGRLEPFADVRYLRQDEFTRDSVADADAMMIRTRTRCNRALLEGSRVKIIATATIGMDQFDLPACREMGITAVNAPGCNAPGVAQYVWSVIGRMGVKPGSTIGVVGVGNVGSIVAQWGRQFGYRILTSDPPAVEAGRRLPEEVEPEELFSRSDVVTLHTPMTRSGTHPTYHLVSDPLLKLMRPGTLLINAARGPVTDTDALLRAISDRGIRVAIDCWEGEPETNADLLRLADVATFHIAGYSTEGKQRATRMALHAIAGHFGFSPSYEGLAGDYRPDSGLTLRRVVDSFDPTPIMELLRRNPESFDRLRAEYQYRNEP